MSEGELKRRVSVWGKPYEISLYRKSKSVWIAVGDYMVVMYLNALRERRD
jgi:hypothetical protein